MTIQNLRLKVTEMLKEAFSKNSKLESQLNTVSLDCDVIISHFLDRDRTWIMFHRDFEVPEDTEKMILEAAARRTSGLPVAYITNRKEFYGLDFYVDQNVLIPKPDTELLVEETVKRASEFFEKNRMPPAIIDMCSGSGCVGTAAAYQLLEKGISGFSMTFADISPAALKITEKNWQNITGSKIQGDFVLSNLFSAFENNTAGFDIIVTNPPYVPHSESMELLQDGRSEPLLALDGDVDLNSNYCGTKDGLSLIRRLVPQCYEHLNEGGTLLMETGEYNAEETAELFKAAGFKNIYILKDMNNMLRDVCGTKE